MGTTNLRNGWSGLVQALVDSEGRGIRARMLLESVARESWVQACGLWRREAGPENWTCILSRGPDDLLPSLAFLQEAAAGRTPADLVPGRGLLFSGSAPGALALTYAGTPESDSDLDLVVGLLHVARLVDSAESVAGSAPVEAYVPALPRTPSERAGAAHADPSCSPAALLATIAESEAPLCSRSRIQLEIALQPGCDTLRIPMPASEFVQAIRSLVSNAREALEPMQAGGRVRVSLERTENGLVRVAVEDTGPGIPEEVLSALRSGHPNELPGPGLGLAVSLGIAALSGGCLRAAASSESGTRLEFDVPECGYG